MVIKKSGGSKPEYSNVTINTENRDITFKDIENALPRRGLVKIKTTTVTPNEEVKKDEKVEKHLTKLDLPVANTENNKKSVNGVNTNPQVKSVLTTPIQISEEIKAEAIAESKKEEKVSRDTVEDLIEKLIKDINTIEFDDIKVELCAKIIDKLGDVLETKDLGNLMIAKLAEDSKELSEYPEFTRSEDMEEFIANTFICDVVFSGATITEKGDVDVSYGCTIYDKHDTEQVTVYDGLEERISEADVTNKLPVKEVVKEVEVPVEKIVEVPVEVEKVAEVPTEISEDQVEEEENAIRQIKLYNGIHMNISEIVPDISRDEDYEVYIPVDEEGEYLVVDHSLVGIGTLDDRDIDQIQVVSKEWFKEVSKEHEEELAATEPTEEVEEEETEEEVDYSEAVPENGMSVEEFLEAEAAAEESSEEEVEEQE